MKRRFVIAVDFDGTIVTHAYPDIKQEVPGAIRWLKRWQELGAAIILYTMRNDSEKEGPVLSQAVSWLQAQGIKLFGANYNPMQSAWSESPKVYAHVYVDDAAYGCPTFEMGSASRPVVDWDQVGPGVERMIEKWSSSNGSQSE